MGGSIAIKNPRRIFSQAGGGGTDPALESRVEYLENNEYKITYYANIISASGQITAPTGATILLDQFQGGVDAYATTIQNSQPTGIFPQTSGGVTVDVTSFDALGNYVLTGTPSSFPVALIYVLKIRAADYANLVTANILTEDRITSFVSITGDPSLNLALVSYIEDEIATPIRDCGTFDFSGNLFPSTGGTGTAGAIEKGNLFSASVSGSPGGVTVTAPYDTVTARIDNPGQTLVNWRIQSNTVPTSSSIIITTVTSSAAPTPVVSTDLVAVDILQVTALATAPTFPAPTGTAQNGKRFVMRIKDNGTARALAFNAVYRFSSDIPAPTTTIINKTMYLGFQYNSADSVWDCLAYNNNY